MLSTITNSYLKWEVLNSQEWNWQNSTYCKIHSKNPTRSNNVPKLYSLFIWSSTCFSDTPPNVRSLKLHWQFLVFHTWKVVGRVVGGRFQAHNVPENVQRPHVQQPSTYENPKAASAVLGFWWWAVCRQNMLSFI
jgi:hypothetical protein